MKATRRFDLLEVALIAAAVGIVVLVVTLHTFSALDAERPYRARYGSKVSAGPEEWLIRDFFQDERDGVFVDVGANHFRDNSNTYFLETQLGWSGLAVDPQLQFADDYRQHRPQTQYVQVFVSDRPGTTPFFIPARNAGVASADEEYVAGVDTIAERLQTATTTLTALLEKAGIGRFDLLSMDIERAEPQALAGFDLRRFRPRLVCVEAHAPVRQAILNYFTERDYVLVGKYWGVDNYNMYFTPLELATAR